MMGRDKLPPSTARPRGRWIPKLRAEGLEYYVYEPNERRMVPLRATPTQVEVKREVKTEMPEPVFVSVPIASDHIGVDEESIRDAVLAERIV